ncbi:hypothetical protein RYH73_01200 [Olivibacter sp. CPCC 100613]|uniref:hypothetical protein n=1 Tax=Olivibacter sp. CPCC 100613 TaxID=3079931 RepID=UPI002FF8756C
MEAATGSQRWPFLIIKRSIPKPVNRRTKGLALSERVAPIHGWASDHELQRNRQAEAPCHLGASKWDV